VSAVIKKTNMKEKILIAEDEFIVANDIKIMLNKAGYEVCGIAPSVEEAKSQIEKQKPTWVLLDIHLQNGSMGTDLGEILTQKGIGFIYVSANTNESLLEKAKATQPYGFLVKPFREKDLLITMEIAMEKHRSNISFNQQREHQLLQQLDLIINSSLEESDRMQRIPAIFQGSVPFDLMRISFSKRKSQAAEEIIFNRVGFNEYQLLKDQELSQALGMSVAEIIRSNRRQDTDRTAGFYNGSAYVKLPAGDAVEIKINSRFRIESKLLYFIELNFDQAVCISFYSRKPDTYAPAHINALKKSAIPLKHLLESFNLGNAKLVPGFKDKTQAMSKSIQVGFHGIIGDSPALLRVLDKIAIVSPAQSSVLILGDSGTGKERIAQCIHELSPRKAMPLITVNCAALPKELIESELFGHEKGAFTGALEKRIGKFEQADGGTIFGKRQMQKKQQE
jgi:response regulator of citrate/malate metabolism